MAGRISEAAMLPTIDIILRLVVAAALGSLIGFERERQSWAAGLRTHMLVSVGACLFMIVSSFGFADILGHPNVVLDPSRVAAQVVSGIGFLGAGAILLRGEVVRGLTTAASVWSVAAVGLAVGGGLYIAAVAATLIILVILAGIKPIEEKFRERKQTFELAILADHGALSLDLLRATLGERTRRVKQFVVHRSEAADQDDVTIVMSRVTSKDVSIIAGEFRALPCVRDVREVRA
jgi:putative Mg2+ transporter-C (MgtC) family protein